MYKIIQAKNKNVVYASGFYDIANAQTWIESYNPNHWMDKTIHWSELQIVEDVQKSRKRRK